MRLVSPSKNPQPQTLVKLLHNAAGQLIGHTVRDLETGTVTPFWYPKGLQPPAPPVQTPQPPRVNVWQELADMAAAYLTRRVQARPPIALGACWPDVPPAPQTLPLVVERQVAQGLRTEPTRSSVQ
jgi:hypothetical protein